MLSIGAPKAFYKVQEKSSRRVANILVAIFFNMCIHAHVHLLVQVHSITVLQCKLHFILNFNIN